MFISFKSIPFLRDKIEVTWKSRIVFRSIDLLDSQELHRISKVISRIGSSIDTLSKNQPDPKENQSNSLNANFY